MDTAQATVVLSAAALLIALYQAWVRSRDKRYEDLQKEVGELTKAFNLLSSDYSVLKSQHEISWGIVRDRAIKMLMNPDSRRTELLRKYQADELTDDEHEELVEMLEQKIANEERGIALAAVLVLASLKSND